MRRRGWWALPAAVTVCVLASFARRLPAALWGDEVFAVGAARSGWGGAARYMATDAGAPGWPWLLRAWASVGGWSPTWLHALALLELPAGAALVYVLARQLGGGVRGASIAAAAAAAAPGVYGGGVDARPYLLCGVVAVGAGVAARRSWLAAGVLVGVAGWVSYWGAAGAAVTVAAILPTWRARAGAGMAALAVIAPWLPAAAGQLGSASTPWADPPHSMAGPFRVVAEWAAGAVWLPALGLLCAGRLRASGPAPRRVLVALAVTVALLWVVALRRPSWDARYLAAFVWPALAAAGAHRITRRARWVRPAVAGGLALTAAGLLPAAVGGLPGIPVADLRTDAPALARWVEHRCPTVSAVIGGGPYDTEPLAASFPAATFVGPTGVRRVAWRIPTTTLVAAVQAPAVGAELAAIRSAPAGSCVVVVDSVRPPTAPPPSGFSAREMASAAAMDDAARRAFGHPGETWRLPRWVVSSYQPITATLYRP